MTKLWKMFRCKVLHRHDWIWWRATSDHRSVNWMFYYCQNCKAEFKIAEYIGGLR